MIISDSDDDQEPVSKDGQQEQEDQNEEDNEDEGQVTGNEQARYNRQQITMYTPEWAFYFIECIKEKIEYAPK